MERERIMDKRKMSSSIKPGHKEIQHIPLGWEAGVEGGIQI